MNTMKTLKIITTLMIMSTFCMAESYSCPDLHTDDTINFYDFAAMAGNWRLSGKGLRGDLFEDGTVDIYDLEQLSYYWLKDYECKSADFNLDYVINFTDFAELAEAWFIDANSTNWDAAYDLDHSGSIDLDDLAIFCRRWLKQYPEPNGIFDSFKDALAASDVDAAVSYFADSVAEEYTIIFGELQDVLPDMAAGMGELRLIYSDDNVARYEMLHDEGGGVISSFPVYFSKDADGNWKIYCF